MGSDTDKYDSSSDGFCMQIKGESQQRCHFLDWTFSYNEFAYLQCSYSSVRVYPGETVLSLICDDSKHYQIGLYNPKDWETSKIYSLQEIPCESRNYKFWETTYYPGNTSMSLMFRFTGNFEDLDTGYCLLLGNSERSRSIPFMNVIVASDCPFGFSLTKNNLACNCTTALREHGFKCFINNMSFVSPPHYWIDMELTSNTYTGFRLSDNCPPNSCRNTLLSKDFNLSDAKFVSELFCLNNHAGVLCGKCKQNYSVAFGSDACYAHCSNLYLLTLPLYALAGILLVVALFALRLTVATGTINGLIFYANVLELSMNVFSHENTEFYLAPFHIVISLLNINLGFPVCFYEGMTQAGKAGLQFVFPVYLWIIVIGLIVASRNSVWLSNHLSGSSVQVLATLFYLSFAKLLVTAIYVMSSASYFFITDEVYSQTSNNTVVVWYYGGTPYGSGSHGFLVFLTAIFTVFFIVPYTISLTIPCILMRLKAINRFRLLFDAYGGPFKDKWRFWFGLRLWITATMLAVNGALQGTDTDTMLKAHFVVVLFFIILQAHVNPFRNQLVGALDMFFMLNYLLTITFYLQFKESKSFFPVAYILLLSLAMLAFAIIVLFHVFYFWIYLKKQDTFHSLKEKLFVYFKKYEAVQNEDINHSDEDLFNAAEERVPIIDTY